jgi:hypothetical protein
MIEFIILAVIATFVGVAVLGHILVFQAIFGRIDKTHGKTEKLPAGRYSGSGV